MCKRKSNFIFNFYLEFFFLLFGTRKFYKSPGQKNREIKYMLSTSQNSVLNVFHKNITLRKLVTYEY